MVLSTLYSLLSTLYSLLSTLYSLLSTLYSVYSKPDDGVIEYILQAGGGDALALVDLGRKRGVLALAEDDGGGGDAGQVS